MVKIGGYVIMKEKELEEKLELIAARAVLDWLSMNASLVQAPTTITKEDYHPAWGAEV